MAAKLNKDLAHYELLEAARLPQKGSFGRFGEIDFSTLTDKQADNLLKFGFPYLKKTATVATKPAKKRKK